MICPRGTSPFTSGAKRNDFSRRRSEIASKIPRIMPGITLVVCLYKERDLLERLLREAAGCYDDLVVVHDGPEAEPSYFGTEKPAAIDYSQLFQESPVTLGYQTPSPVPQGSVQEMVTEHGGRFFAGPRCFQQEPHWPFAWSQAQHDWILRLDADEFPSEKLKDWLKAFRARDAQSAQSGFTSVWPLWNGRKAVTRNWPGGRHFLFNRQAVRFFGMVEQVPVPDTPMEDLDLVLHHQPKRKSYGLRNIVFRRQAFYWRRVICESLLANLSDLPRWRWHDREWPAIWRELQSHPMRTALRSLLKAPLWQGKEMIRKEGKVIPSAVLGTGLHHFLLALTFLWSRNRRTSGNVKQ
jgi:hypothetical protein